MFRYFNKNVLFPYVCLKIIAHIDMRKKHIFNVYIYIVLCLCSIIKDTEFSTISEFRFLAMRRGFAGASISISNVFPSTVATRSIRRWQTRRSAGAGRSTSREARQKEGRSEKEEHLTLCLAACRTQLIPKLLQRILVRARRALINVSRVCW